MALGWTHPDCRAGFARSVADGVAGLVVGIPAAMATARLMRSELYGLGRMTR